MGRQIKLEMETLESNVVEVRNQTFYLFASNEIRIEDGFAQMANYAVGDAIGLLTVSHRSLIMDHAKETGYSHVIVAPRAVKLRLAPGMEIEIDVHDQSMAGFDTIYNAVSKYGVRRPIIVAIWESIQRDTARSIEWESVLYDYKMVDASLYPAKRDLSAHYDGPDFESDGDDGDDDDYSFM